MSDSRQDPIWVLRNRWDITQGELAERVNGALETSYAKSAVSKWESGKTRPPLPVLEFLENEAGLRAGYLQEAYGYLEGPIADHRQFSRFSSEFQAGAMKLHLARILGGDGRIRYGYPDGIKTVLHNKTFKVPPFIEDYSDKLLRLRKSEAKAFGASFENRNMLRLDDFEFGLTDIHDQPYPLTLHVSFTDYFSMMTTNRSLNTKVSERRLPIRDTYAKDPNDFLGSGLANPLAVNLSLVTTKDRKIYVAQRGQKVSTNSARFGPAVSGTASPVDLEAGQYNPFLTAQRESFEEVTGPFKPEFSQIVFFGLGRTLEFYFPFLFGELRLDITQEQLRSFTPQDNWDVSSLISIPFNTADVIAYMKKTYTYMMEQRDFGYATAIFSLYQSLIYEYPDRRTEIDEALQHL